MSELPAPAATRENPIRLGLSWASISRLFDARLTWIYVVVALVWGAFQVFLVPPFQVPDEGDHFFRAWAVSSGQLTADANGQITIPATFSRLAGAYFDLLGGANSLEALPKSLDGTSGLASYGDLFNGHPSTDMMAITSRVSNYGPVGYLPQAIGIDVGRILGLAPLACFYLARFANLLASIALIALGIRRIPFGKAAMLFVALLPMTMFMLASASCDALTLAGAFAFTGLALRAARQETLSGRQMLVLVLAAGVLLNVKPGYWALALLTVLVPASAAGGQARKWMLVGACAIATAAAFGITYELTVGIRPGTPGSSHSQLAFILGDPIGFLGIVANTMHDQWFVLFFETIGILGWLSVWLQLPAYGAAFLAVPLTIFRGADEGAPTRTERLVLVAVAGGVLMTMAVALYAFLSPPGATMFGVQGRYFIPVLLMALLAICGVKVTARPRARQATIAIAIVLMGFTFQALIAAYGL